VNKREAGREKGKRDTFFDMFVDISNDTTAAEYAALIRRASGSRFAAWELLILHSRCKAAWFLCHPLKVLILPEIPLFSRNAIPVNREIHFPQRIFNSSSECRDTRAISRNNRGAFT